MSDLTHELNKLAEGPAPTRSGYDAAVEMGMLDSDYYPDESFDEEYADYIACHARLYANSLEHRAGFKKAYDERCEALGWPIIPDGAFNIPKYEFTFQGGIFQCRFHLPNGDLSPVLSLKLISMFNTDTGLLELPYIRSLGGYDKVLNKISDQIHEENDETIGYDRAEQFNSLVSRFMRSHFRDMA